MSAITHYYRDKTITPPSRLVDGMGKIVSARKKVGSPGPSSLSRLRPTPFSPVSGRQAKGSSHFPAISMWSYASTGKSPVMLLPIVLRRCRGSSCVDLRTPSKFVGRILAFGMML